MATQSKISIITFNAISIGKQFIKYNSLHTEVERDDIYYDPPIA